MPHSIPAERQATEGQALLGRVLCKARFWSIVDTRVYRGNT